MSKGISPREAICHYCGWDLDDLKANRYMEHRSKLPVYGTDTGFVCATRSATKQPRTGLAHLDGEWKLAPWSSTIDWLWVQHNVAIWICDGKEER